jgi:hypothetical protein
MDQIDLNIKSYNYNELLKLFKIDINNIKSHDSLCHTLQSKVNNIRSTYSSEIYDFFNKGRVIISTIYDFLINKLIQDNTEIPEYINKITNIQDFEKRNNTDLYKLIVSANIDNYYNTTVSDTNELNTPYFNTAGRINPSLNNKNNTNIVYNTAVNEVSPGDLNSVKRVTQLLNLNINSCFRTNYYQSNPCDFLYIIPSEITKVISMRLVSIEIPNSWYLFSNDKKNNWFEISIEVEEVTTYCYDISIPEGNYDCDSLQEYLNRTYFYESGLDNYLKYIKFFIDPRNLKSQFEIIEIDMNPSPKITFSLKFSQNINHNIMNTFGWTIGFRLGNYLKMCNVISEGLFDAGGDRYIYLAINDFQYNNNTSNIVCFDKSILNEDVIAKIPMIDGKLSLIINDNNNSLAKIRRYNGPINLNRLHIKILDHFGSVVDLNNMDFSMTLELEILYENFNFKNVTS